jgi:hypothetical protein
VGWVACRVGSIGSIGWLAGLGDGPIDPSPRVMNIVYVYIYIFTDTHTHTYIVVDTSRYLMEIIEWSKLNHSQT